MRMAEESLPRISDGRSSYDRWIERERVAVVGGYYIPDLRELALAPWPRKGVQGAVLRLVGAEDTTDCHVLELPPGGQTEPEHHIYEEIVFVLSGRGATTVSYAADRRHTFEWQRGSLFSIPLNAAYRHYNGRGGEAARLMSVTNAPLMINLFHNEDFVFQNDFAFRDRYDPDDANFFGGAGASFAGRVFETNFVPNVDALDLLTRNERGAGGRNRRIEIGNNSLTAHISEFPVGTYKKAHRHGPGAHVLILEGEGYSLMWPEGSPMQRFDWRPGAVIVPPDRWFHQHFNVGETPARYLALRWGSQKYRVFRLSGSERSERSLRDGGDQIEYADEAPQVREMFVEACAARGVPVRMAEFWER